MISEDYSSCCPWIHGLRPKKLSVSMAVPPAPVRVPSERPLAPSVASVTSVANYKGDNEMVPGAVNRSPSICLTTEEKTGKPQIGNHQMKGLCDQSSPKVGSLSSIRFGQDRTKQEDHFNAILFLLIYQNGSRIF